MKWRRASILGITIVLIGVGFAMTQGAGGNKEEEGVKKAFAAYVDSFNKGDLNTVLGYWTEDGEQIDEDGKVTHGKAALAASLKELCKPNSGVSLKPNLAAIKILGGNVALIDGTVEITSAEGSDTSGFDGVMVFDAASKRWLFSRVRDLPFDDNMGNSQCYSQLKCLEWLIGNWTSVDGDSTITFNANWMKNKSYIVVDQTIKLKDSEVLSLSMYIGYDALNDKTRSWVFDSQGGHGEAEWTRNGNVWHVVAAGTTVEGKTSSASIFWKFIDANTFEWNATARQLDSQPRPDVKVIYKRNVPKL